MVSVKSPDLAALVSSLAGASEGISDDPGGFEAVLEDTISEARHYLDLDGIGLHASVSERIEVRAGDSTEARIPQEAEEFPLMRGKIRIGSLWGSRGDGEPLDAEQVVGMRAVSGFCSLVAEGARARELAAIRAAPWQHGTARLRGSREDPGRRPPL